MGPGDEDGYQDVEAPIEALHTQTCSSKRMAGEPAANTSSGEAPSM